ncbi:Uncharacterised protein [Salmonella enterica subsp. enterica]|uniref:Uncharacterized protein n=1 Tax=Salmonella enterica I TaxID=59201 RepID=A0A379V113_SALET|nr:Uncharacterised protein [Salmonella enterica subsp. enterica]
MFSPSRDTVYRLYLQINGAKKKSTINKKEWNTNGYNFITSVSMILNSLWRYVSSVNDKSFIDFYPLPGERNEQFEKPDLL